jgi:hypothetical protein
MTKSSSKATRNESLQMKSRFVEKPSEESVRATDMVRNHFGVSGWLDSDARSSIHTHYRSPTMISCTHTLQSFMILHETDFMSRLSSSNMTFLSLLHTRGSPLSCCHILGKVRRHKYDNRHGHGNSRKLDYPSKT